MQNHQQSNAINVSESVPKSNIQSDTTVKETSLDSGVFQLQSVLADPSLPLTPSHILQLQKTIGNRAVVQLMNSRKQSMKSGTDIDITEEKTLQQNDSNLTIQRALPKTSIMLVKHDSCHSSVGRNTLRTAAKVISVI